MLKKRLVSMLFLLIFLFSNIGWSMSVHYCQGEAHYSPLRYAHTHLESGCVMESTIESEPQREEKSCCSTQTPIEEAVKKFADKQCCQNDLIKSNPSDHNIQHVYAPHFDFILPDYSWTTLTTPWVYLPAKKQETLAYYLEANAPPLYQLHCRLVFYA